MDNHHWTWKVKAKQRGVARSLRKDSTDAERLLWASLRHHRLNGASFRRQVPIANFVADFVCHAAKLVIELDGGQHYSDAGEHSDAVRTSVIEQAGFRVLRFSNHDVMTNRDGVLEAIAAAIEESAPTPTLPRKSGRGSPAIDAEKPADDLREIRIRARRAPSLAYGGGLGWGHDARLPRPAALCNITLRSN